MTEIDLLDDEDETNDTTNDATLVVDCDAKEVPSNQDDIEIVEISEQTPY